MTVRLSFSGAWRFYEANGYFGMSHSRIRRCEILLEFLALYLHGCDSDAMTSVGLFENHGDRDNTDFDENAQIYSMIQESLIFDLYYRENCKSRPRWATDIGSFKHMTHAYCKNGKLSHVEPFHYIFLTSTCASWMNCQSIIRSRCGRFSTTT